MNIIKFYGNSSQLIHPVGAQGFNLGVRNIETIIDACNSEVKEDVSHYIRDLNNAAKKILQDRDKIFEMTDIATKLFANPKSISKVASSLLVNSLKIIPGTKASFLKKILGLDDCSYLTIRG